MKRILIILIFLALFGCGSGTGNSQNVNGSKGKIIELDIPIDERFTITQATYSIDTYGINGGGFKEYIGINLKIQNNTNEDYEKIALHINGYDKNGDKVGSCSIDVNDIEAGHAVWANHIHPDVLAEEFGSIKISYYEVMEWVGQNTVSAKEKVNLDPKPEVTFDQMSKY